MNQSSQDDEVKIINDQLAYLTEEIVSFQSHILTYLQTSSSSSFNFTQLDKIFVLLALLTFLLTLLTLQQLALLTLQHMCSNISLPGKNITQS